MKAVRDIGAPERFAKVLVLMLKNQAVSFVDLSATDL